MESRGCGFWVVLWSVVVNAAVAAALSCDGRILLEVKKSFGDPGGVLRSWVVGTGTHCNWTGVVCDSDGDRVVELSLRMVDLSGTISPSIGELHGLQRLDLSGNELTGNVPTDFGRLLNLSYVNLSENNLRGLIPLEFGLCRRLGSLSLARNYLRGGIPPEFGGLVELELLDLSSNWLEGTIPPELGSCGLLSVLNLGRNRFSGQLPVSVLSRFTHLTELHLSRNMFRGPVDVGLGTLLKVLKVLNLSGNSLTGGIPTEIKALQMLESLDLSDNMFCGQIPSAFGSMQALKSLNLSHNYLSGNIPEALLNSVNLRSLDLSHNSQILVSVSGKTLPGISFVRNAELSGRYVSSRSLSSSNSADGGSKGLSTGALAGIIVGAFLAALILVIAAVYVAISWPKKTTPAVRPFLLPEIYRGFTYSEIMEATKNLSEENIIGRGGFGTLYRGAFASGQVHAVKAIIVEHESSRTSMGQSHLREIEVAGNIRHRNCVKLIGFCQKQELTLVVFDYIPNGSLGDALHDPVSRRNLDWGSRFKIVLGTAHGLDYLHNECRQRIVHRDLKSNNILLDDDMEPLITDFGVVKLMENPDGTIPNLWDVAGNAGYIAPEYEQDMKLTDKSDVYNFGVILLELLTGKQPGKIYRVQGRVDLVRWVKSTLVSEGSQNAILDSALQDVRTNRKDQITLVLQAALLCVNENPYERPNMKEVVEMLHYAKGDRGKLVVPDLTELLLV